MPNTLRPARALTRRVAVGTVYDMVRECGPIGYWPLNETSGTTANDHSGNGRNGTYTGSGFTLAGAAGPDGGYVDLGNAASSHISIADNNVWSLDNANGLTMFAMVKPDSVAGTTRQFIASKGAASNFEWGWDFNSGAAARITFFAWTAAGLEIASQTVNSRGTTQWQCVIAAITSPSTTSLINLHQNGDADIGTFSGPGGTYANGTAALQIGWRADSPASQYWQGGIAHFALFAGRLAKERRILLMAAAREGGWF